MSNNSAGGFRNDVVSGTLGVVVAYAIGILSLPLITQFYQPEHIGSWQILLASINLLVPLATLQLDNAVVLERSRSITSQLLAVIVVNATIICIILLVVGLFIGDEMTRFLKFGGTKDVILISVAGLICQVGLLSLNALIIKQKKFRVQATAKISGALAVPVFAVATLLFFEASSTAYIIASLSGILIQVLLLYRSVGNQQFQRIPGVKKAFHVIKKYKVYPVYMVPYSLSQAAVWQVTLTSFGILFSTGVVGAYTVARQIVYMPISLLSVGLKQAVFSHAASAPAYDATINAHIRRLLLNIAALAAPFTVFGFFHLPACISLALGEGWDQAGTFSSWILLSAAALMLTSWLDRIFDVYGRQRFAVFLQIFSDLLFLLVLSVCYFMDAGVLATIISLSMFITVYNLIWLYIVLKIMRFENMFWFQLVSRLALGAIFFLALMKLLEAVLPLSFAVSVEGLLLVSLVYYQYNKISGVSHG